MRVESNVTALSIVKPFPVLGERPESVKEVKEEKANEGEVIKVIEQANQKLCFSDAFLKFSIHEKTRQIMVKVYREDRLIREIPPEKVLDMVAQMMEWAGLFVDELA